MLELENLFKSLDKNGKYIFIIKDNLRRLFLKTIAKEKRLINFKLKTRKEVITDASFIIKDTAFLLIANLHKISYANSHEVLESLYYEEFAEKTDREDFQNLTDLSKFLLKNKEIDYSYFPKFYYPEYQVFIIDFEPDALLVKALNRLKVSYTTMPCPKITDQEVVIATYDEYKEEINKTIAYIVKLIEDGEDLTRMRINCYKNSYLPHLKLMLGKAGVPFIFNSNPLLSSSEVATSLLNFIANEENIDFERILTYLLHLPTITNEIYQAILNLLNNFQSFLLANKKEENLKLLHFLFSITTYNLPSNNTGILITSDNFATNYYKHLFMLGATEQDFRKTHQENIFISDQIMKKHQYETSKELTKYDEQALVNLLNSASHLYISAAKQSLEGSEELSTFVINLFKSHTYENSLYLNPLPEKSSFPFYYQMDAINSLDEYRLTNKNELISFYRQQFPEIFKNYNSYNNQFKIDKSLDFLFDKTFTLSPTSIKEFFKCRFKFYLDYVLKINPAELDNPAIKIGILFHQVLEKINSDTKDLAIFIENALDVFFAGDNSPQVPYFRTNIRKIITKFILEISTQQQNSAFSLFGLEKHFTIPLESKYNLRFVGIIDKIMKFTSEEIDYYVVVDYKSGNVEALDKEDLKYGFNIQLISYCYFLKHHFNLNDSQIAGIYLQSLKPGKSLKKLDETTFDLVGLTQVSMLPFIDKNYQETSFIKGVKNGGLRSTYQVTAEELSSYISLVSGFLDEVINAIENSQFPINPKLLGKKNENLSCSYCSNRDICCYQSEDLEIIDEEEAEETIDE